MRKTILILAASLPFTTLSQQDPSSTMFWNNYAHFNPATSGLEHGHAANVTYRNHQVSQGSNWFSLSGNYNTIVADHHGIGVNVSQNNTALNNFTQAFINYNYQFSLNNHRKIAIGVAPGWGYLTAEDYWTSPMMQEPQLYKDQQQFFQLNSGIAYSGRKLYGGVGVTHAIASPRTFQGTVYSYSVEPQFYAHLRYRMTLTRKFTLYLESIGYAVNGFNSLEFNARVEYWKKLTVGASYRSRDTWAAIIQWDIKQRYRLGYSFEQTVSKLNNAVSGGIHEFTLGLRIP